ncbi:hypothetical protein [Plantibacter cousiniae (nom. nud.)]|uniref:hypothetical protein n=1 Tax=Plantibacter cousiniae (nom. nud.) TaxID=199709 RepID=UPI001DB8F984|nr:hypothetical protein [Plantibacter cousiniae]CAH0242651.1 hypothetical protein SRABI02_02973 [Plantibacter cousiniae]
MLRFAPGYHLYATAPDSWRLAEPGGRYQRIAGPDDRMTLIAQALSSGTELASLGPDAEALGEQLLRRGALIDDTTQATPPETPKQVCILGRGPVVDALQRALEAQPSLIQVILDDAEPDAVISVEPWFRDRHWMELAARQIPLHRCHDDGLALFVGPFSVDARTASYLDYRGRRRAADPLLEELEALWTHLDALPTSPLDAAPGVACLAAAVIAADLFAWAAGTDIPNATTEVEIRVDGSLRRHPVLPLPTVTSL